MLSKMVKIAVGQIRSTNDLIGNARQCTSIIEKAAKAGAQAVFLPEAADYIASSAKESLSLAAPATESPFLKEIRKAAKTHKLPVSVGVHEPGDNTASKINGGDKPKVKNTLLWIDEQGDIAQRYQKIHLFDIDQKDGLTLKESDSVEAGTDLLEPFDSELGKIGSLICFDLRFPASSLKYRQKGATVLLYPSAFAPNTGKAHWMTLLRARAIETQCFVIASAQVGSHNEETARRDPEVKERKSYGHSAVIDPWGEVLCDMSGEWNGEPEVEIVDLKLEDVERVRKEMPLDHTRED